MTTGELLSNVSTVSDATALEHLQNITIGTIISGGIDLGIDNISIPRVSIYTTSIEKAAAGVSKSIRDLNLKIC